METFVDKINKASLKFLTPLDAEMMYQVIVDEAKKLFDTDYGSIFLAEKNNLERVYATANFLKEIKIRSHGFTYRTFKSHKPYLINVEDTPNFHKLFNDYHIKSIIHIPLSYKSESIGVLTLHSTKSKFVTHKELDILKLYGSLASLAIKKTQLYDESKKAIEIRDLFISLASHELRTPLTSINGYIQLLYSKLGKLDTNEGKWIRELNEESQRMTNLVKELLEVNRIRQGQFQFSFIESNMMEVVKKSIHRLGVVSEREIHFRNKTTESQTNLIGDPEKLLQMVNAILENAIKFSQPHFSIEVTLRSTKKQIILTIIDKGVGIDKKDLEHIMQGFYKGTQQEKEGIGVGLVLARHIIQAHHGTIVMNSQVNHGTKVEIKLPRI